jgi:hypothetical protein
MKSTTTTTTITITKSLVNFQQYSIKDVKEQYNFYSGTQSCYSFCPKCGVDITQFSHEDNCPHANHQHAAK